MKEWGRRWGGHW